MRDRLLVRHFLLRFIDHDLISPHADRREVLTVTCALVVVCSLFLSFFLAVKYQFNLFLPPGMTSLLALDDRFFLLSLAMIVMALLAVAEWDALGLDARDAAVLGPLPVPTPVIVRAKFVAIALFAAAFDVGLAIGPTALRALALPVKLPISMFGALRLTGAHALCMIASGAFGFVAILGIREVCRAVAGPVVFRRFSAALQAALVVSLLTALLLLPGSYSPVALRWMSNRSVPASAVPSLWFVGLHEVIAGDVIDGLPRGEPPRRFAKAEREATTLYRTLSPTFHRLAAVAMAGSLAVLLLTAVACAWNHRRLPSDTIAVARRSRRAAAFAALLVRRTAVRSPVAQAGFFFTIQTLTRSASHRVALAAAVAVAFALALITLNATGLHRTLIPASAPVSLFALQTGAVAILLSGYRHLIRVPADPRASWGFQLAWSGDERHYVSGSKRAALALLAAPALLAMFAVATIILGPPVALVHAVVGAMVAALLIGTLLITYRKLPFATGYAGSGDLKAILPLYALALLFSSIIIARIERATLKSMTNELVFVGALATIAAIVGVVDVRRRAVPAWFEFDELPAGGTQRLELNR